jgi:hypothetical protein
MHEVMTTLDAYGSFWGRTFNRATAWMGAELPGGFWPEADWPLSGSGWR